MRHKHADIIHAWVEGAEIEYKEPEMRMWFKWDSTSWNDELEYRIKPEWWVNIPEHGILVENIFTGCVAKIGATPNPISPQNYRPLTNEEIERFKR